ncbi:glycerol-3-phosphate responsive antiterminator [Clostridium botulinum]|uniref:Antiterminator n=1 Tax=Clostridium botulinum C/D str. DC5 TaxID=1443128 RepID=A0A0A0IC73_CLOBO|nr:glycerol-3-phosphate responsive antiterminator [Clostridium botulinum]KEI00562.1 antiterminator [Clostridium botulinum C/D str. BKT75002]KEI11219.1 antiterminator [Clostridium botulinum C/D str. BKT2873]KGM93651.1 antiterminator [Clostridium botulinum D str. CCUG 7971]KGM98517.1 antiterminator [Clostridium botulinum C/D str. DC5]KOC47828.1 antiterminator [Clostridium botulinum]
MRNQFYDKLSINPIIAAVKDLDKLDRAIKSPCEVIFLLKGNICNIKELVDKVKAVGKSIYVHIDLMDGFARDRYALTHMKEQVNPDGIITTKSNLTKIAKELDLFTIQRLFIIDNLSLETGINSINSMRPNAMEILPGVMPKIIKQVKQEVKVPVIAGGLIKDKEDVIESLKAGALGVSTSKEDIWNL